MRSRRLVGDTLVIQTEHFLNISFSKLCLSINMCICTNVHTVAAIS